MCAVDGFQLSGHLQWCASSSRERPFTVESSWCPRFAIVSVAVPSGLSLWA